MLLLFHGRKRIRIKNLCISALFKCPSSSAVTGHNAGGGFAAYAEVISQLVVQVRAAQERQPTVPEATTKSADLWSKEHKIAAEVRRELDEIERCVNDTVELFGLATECSDRTVISECHDTLEQLHARLKEQEIEGLLSGEFDSKNCYVQINAGAGGIESCDWAGMLAAMYHNWGPKKGFRLSVVDEHANAEVGGAGYRSVTLKLTGDRAYGWLRSEAGVHRLVRISPFDPQKKRHTSFAQVVVYPDLSHDGSSSSSSASSSNGDEIKEGDLKVDTFRASGAGGQHVNKTDSAVRITHKPTGIVVSCQSERSQHQNKATAMSMLQSRLRLLVREQQYALRKQTTVGAGDSISWGNQIRSVVMQPYQLVKDHRSRWETGNVEGFLNGDMLTDAMVAALRETAVKSKHDDS